MMEQKSTKPLHFSISSHRDTDKSIASVAGLILEGRSYKTSINPEGYEIGGAAFPLSHAPVYLSDTKDGCYIASGLTDSDGNFNFHNIPNGRYCIKVDHNNSTICDRKNQLLIDDKVERLDIKAIISDRRMIVRILSNPVENHRGPIEEGISFTMASDYNGMLKFRLNIPLNSIKLEILDLSGWIVFVRSYENISIGYETVVDLNYLERGKYIIQVSGSNYSASKELILH